MKRIINAAFLILTLYAGQLISQTAITPTSEVVVSGTIKSEVTITLGDLRAFPQKSIGDVKIINYRGESKSTFKKVKGIPVVELLKDLKFDVDNERVLSEFYIIFEASDGYRVVFSWNEIFNSDVGKNVFIVTQKNGKSFENIEERLVLLAPRDYRTGRRYVKNLAKIIAKRIGQ